MFRRARTDPARSVTCPSCGLEHPVSALGQHGYVCAECGRHLAMPSGARIAQLADPRTFREIDRQLISVDPLHFIDRRPYRERLQEARRHTGLREAVTTGLCRIGGRPVVLAVFDFGFLGGTMGSVVGEKVANAFEHATRRRIPLVCVAASGGARMQEGLYSLQQMAKTSAALARLAQAHLPYISVLTDPTTGGVSASLAMLGDLNLAEPRALIGFTGPRVIQQTMRETLPEGFQRSEFQLEHGALDMIVDRRDMRSRIAELLRLLLKMSPPEKV